MSVSGPFIADYTNWTKLIPGSPLLNSFNLGWQGIQLAHYCHPLVDLPEIYHHQHMLVIPLGNHVVDWEFTSEGHSQIVSYKEKDYANGSIIITPANLAYKLRSYSAAQTLECLHCYLEPSFLAQVAYESVNPDRVDLLLTLKEPDLLVQQLGLSLKSCLDKNEGSNRFYADAMATALSVHLLRHYATRQHHFINYEDGLSQQKLKQAIEYMQSHLDQDLSLQDIANELAMSQYYFCHLFKKSTGLSPHRYLIQQRLEKGKYLLKNPDRTIMSIAMECGFANPSHFARHFRQYTGMTPKQFRKL